MSTTMEKALAELIGREPSSEEVAKFYRVKEICGFSDHDAMWSVLLAFGHYEMLYAETPLKIAELTAKLIAEHKLALNETAHASGALIQQSLVGAVDRMAKGTTEAVLSQTRQRVRAAATASLGVAAVAALILLGVGFWVGQKVNAADSAWLATPEGAAARKFSELNNIRAMMDCPAEGFKDGVYCVPYDAKRGKAWGWRIK